MSIIIKSIDRPESVITLPVIDGHGSQRRQEGAASQKSFAARADASLSKPQSGISAPPSQRQIVEPGDMAGVAVSAIVPAPEKGNEEQAMQARVAEFREQAQKKGYQEGLKLARDAVEAEWRPRIERLGQMLDNFGNKQEEVLASLEDDIVSLVFEAVCRIVGDRAVSREVSQEAVKRCLATFEKGPLLVRVAPADFEMLSKELPAKNANGATGFHIVEDPRVSLGGCILESERGMLDARLETQIERLRLNLLDARDSMVPT